MKEWLQKLLRPRIEPEQRLFQIRFINTLCNIVYGFLALWVLYFVTSPLMGIGRTPFFQLEIVPIVLTAILTTWLKTRLQTKEMLRISLWISFIYFLLGISLVLFHPAWIYLLLPIFLASIAAIGTLISGNLAYIAAAGNLLVVLLLWFYGRSRPVSAELFDASHGFLFIVMSIFTLFGGAFLLQKVSENIKTTLRLLNDRTQQLVSLAHTDPLTGLGNRRFLIEILEREFSRARRYNRPLSLIYLDLDSFKPINDQFGHLFGDEILRGTAVSLKAVLRATDLFARIGGDEFAVLLPETDLEGSRIVAQKLRRALTSYSAQLDPQVPPLTFCSGISFMHPDDQSIDDMLSRADDAQYLAKKTGKAHTRLETEIPQDQ